MARCAENSWDQGLGGLAPRSESGILEFPLPCGGKTETEAGEAEVFLTVRGGSWLIAEEMGKRKDGPPGSSSQVLAAEPRRGCLDAACEVI